MHSLAVSHVCILWCCWSLKAKHSNYKHARTHTELYLPDAASSVYILRENSSFFFFFLLGNIRTKSIASKDQKTALFAARFLW